MILRFKSGPNLGQRRNDPEFTSQIARIQLSTNQEALIRQLLTQPGVLAASMDLFCFYRGRLLFGMYAFCNLLVKKTSFFVLKAC